MPVAAPSDQVTVPAHPLAVKVKVDGEQTERLAGGVIIGGAAFGLLRNTEIVLLNSLETNKSGLLSPSKSAILVLKAVELIEKSTLLAKELLVKLPIEAVLRNKDILFAKVTNKSGLLSPSKSLMLTLLE